VVKARVEPRSLIEVGAGGTTPGVELRVQTGGGTLPAIQRSALPAGITGPPVSERTGFECGRGRQDPKGGDLRAITVKPWETVVEVGRLF